MIPEQTALPGIPPGSVCESCRRVPWTVLLKVRGVTFAVCIDCAADPDREVTT